MRTRRYLFVIHNPFSFIVALGFIGAYRSDGMFDIVIAHKKSKHYADYFIKKIIDERINVYSFSGFYPLFDVIFSKYDEVFISNPWHARLIPFLPNLFFSKKKSLIDDGYATININYEFNILPKSFVLKLLGRIISNFTFNQHCTVFENPSKSYKKTHSVSNIFLISLKDIKSTLRLSDVEVNNYSFSIVFGGIEKNADDVLKEIKDKNQIFLRKDHPNIKGGVDELGAPSEVFIIMNAKNIFRIYHVGSSVACFTNIFFPDIEVIKID